MLEALRKKGARLAVASSKPIGFVHQILQYFDIEKYFAVVVGSELDGTRSSKEEVVEEALLQLGMLNVPVKERNGICAMIGDRKFDIQGAKAYGLTAVGVRFGFAEKGELEKAGADYIAVSGATGTVEVYTAAGALAASAQAPADGRLTIPVGKGFYIVNAGGHACKIMVK